MNFLAPFFLAGALAVALPVIFHLMRRTTRERKIFSSLMFLKPTPPRMTRRNRLEHIPLLLLRCAAIALLALGFARPFLKRPLPEQPASHQPKLIAVLVDTSASMRRGNLWSQAREKAETILGKAAPDDRVALFTFDRQLTPLITFEEWSSAASSERIALARDRLANASPGWAATHSGQAIIRASDLLAEEDKDEVSIARQIVVISDFQTGSQLGALQGQQWPRGIEVLSERVGTKTSNAGLQLLANADYSATSSGSVRVRVSNEPDSTRERFQVGWARRDGSFVGDPNEIYVPTGQSRVVTLASPGTNSGADRIVLTGDEEPFDNAVFTVPPKPMRVSVIYIGQATATDAREPLYFVQRALNGTPLQNIVVTPLQPNDALSPVEAESAAMFVVSDAPSESLAATLREQANRGKTVLFAPTTAAAAANLSGLLGSPEIHVGEADVRDYAMLGEIDFRHPLFAPFADARFSDFTKIHFWKYRRVDATTIPDSRIVARFDNGDPAIVDVLMGKGHVVFFASAWSPRDSQLPLSSKFVPLLYAALELGGGESETAVPLRVGDLVSLPVQWAQSKTATTVTIPDGSTLSLAAGTTNFSQTTMPGIYVARNGTSEKHFAVNGDAAESRTAVLPLDQLERLGVPVAAATTARSESSARVAAQHQKAADLENRQKLWRWLIAATLGILLIETGVAGWMSRRRLAAHEATAS